LPEDGEAPRPGHEHRGDDPASVRDFFTARADRWDARFPDDGPAFRAAAAELDLRRGDAVLDAGCGTGRALDALRDRVGPRGTVLGIDLTPAMLAAAEQAGRRRTAALAVADAERLPLQDAVLDAVFAAGLLTHLSDPAAGLRECARVVRPGGRLGLFHPVGRARLAARRGRTLAPDDLRAGANLRPLLARCGWSLESLADTEDRYLAVALRT
jgi:SAM-dependent methyltransferase